jgi:hypothetical protein
VYRVAAARLGARRVEVRVESEQEEQQQHQHRGRVERGVDGELA